MFNINLYINFFVSYFLHNYTHFTCVKAFTLLLLAEATNLLCEFHRVQAWQRWLVRGTNHVANRGHCLNMMKMLANQMTVEEFLMKVDELLRARLTFQTMLKTICNGHGCR